MTCDPLDMQRSNRPGSDPQEDYDRIKIVNTMHKGLALSKKFLNGATFSKQDETRLPRSNCVTQLDNICMH